MASCSLGASTNSSSDLLARLSSCVKQLRENSCFGHGYVGRAAPLLVYTKRKLFVKILYEQSINIILPDGCHLFEMLQRLERTLEANSATKEEKMARHVQTHGPRLEYRADHRNGTDVSAPGEAMPEIIKHFNFTDISIFLLDSRGVNFLPAKQSRCHMSHFATDMPSAMVGRHHSFNFMGLAVGKAAR